MSKYLRLETAVESLGDYYAQPRNVLKRLLEGGQLNAMVPYARGLRDMAELTSNDYELTATLDTILEILT